MHDVQKPTSITPILDSGVLPPPLPRKRVLGVCIGLVIGIVFAAVIENAGNSELQPPLALFFYFVILALVVIVHETGHLAAGWSVGFQFSLISIGPVSLRSEYGRLTVQIRRDLGALGYAGMHIGRVSKLRRRLIVFIAAGPLANLISGAIAALIAYSAPPTLRATWAVPFAAGFLVLSFVVAGLSLIPYGSAFRSDGARIWMLLTSHDNTRRWIASCALASQQRMGIRPRDWKQTWLKAVCLVRDGRSDEFAANLLAYIAATDRKDVAASAAYLERALSLARWPQGTQRDFVAGEASYFCAWFRGDVSLAERWLSQMKSSKFATQLLQIRTAVALDCARHNFASAMAGWKMGAEYIDRLPDSKVKRLLHGSWQEWNEEIQQRQSVPLEQKPPAWADG
jgi:Zn-dependent protease